MILYSDFESLCVSILHRNPFCLLLMMLLMNYWHKKLDFIFIMIPIPVLLLLHLFLQLQTSFLLDMTKNNMFVKLFLMSVRTTNKRIIVNISVLCC